MLDQSNQQGTSEPAQNSLAGTTTVDGRGLPQLVNGAPDWSRIDYDVHCSRCGYNLRTLTRPLCPECGLTFEWQQVLDRRQWSSAFLFEHQWRNRPLRSWLRTVWRAFRSGRFWREDVSLHSETHVGPLIFMLVSSVVCFFIVIEMLCLLGYLATYGLHEATVGVPVWPPRYNKLTFAISLFESLCSAPIRAPVEFTMIVAFAAAYPLFLLIMLCSLRQTLAKCRVRTTHMIRVVAYNAAPCGIILATITIPIFVGTELNLLFRPIRTNLALTEMPLIMIVLPTIVFGLFTTRGLREYLEIPRAKMVGFVCAFVASLAVFTIAFTWMIQM